MTLREGAREVVRRLTARGHRALFAGGCVRDMHLGIVPQDYDVATDADLQEVIGIFPDARAVGAHFGVVVVPVGPHTYEVARFRRDLGYSDGRHPDAVAPADEREDARRRDFTVNGMFYDPETGRTLDYVGGLRDLERRVIRAIGSARERFREDRLRVLRAVRFGARLNWPIEPDTLAAAAQAAAGIRQVSPERIRDELLMMLTEGGAPQGIRWMIDTGLLGRLLPEVWWMSGVPQPRQFHPEGDVLTHTLIMLGLMRRPSPELALGVLLHDVGKPATFRRADRIRFHGHPRAGADVAERVCGRLRLSAGQTHHVSALVAQHHRFMHVRRMRESTLKRFLRIDRFHEHLALHRLDCLASHGKLGNHAFCVQALERFGPEAIRPTPLLTGRDLIGLGFRPGPAFGRVLAEVEDAQLEGRVRDREGALDAARRAFERAGIRPEE